MDTLIPRDSNPFFIVSPPYTRGSAGINVLYMICHYLNVAGEKAFIVNYPPDKTVIHNSMNLYPSTNECPGSYIAPILTQEIIEFYHARRLTPVVLYPEVFDNPLKAEFFGRYILNYPGKASVQRYSEVEDFAIAYSETLAEYVCSNYDDRAPVTDVLFIPTMDLAFWNRNGAAPIRRGTCFYAGKMRSVHGALPENVPKGSVEIQNHTKMSQVEVRRYFWRSEVFYCYEDSALAIEAQLCGCPTVFVPNQLFDGNQLAAKELGSDGSCIWNEENGLERAIATVDRVETNIRRQMSDVPERIVKLALEWKAKAQQTAYRGTVDYPFEPRLVFVPKLDAALEGDRSEAGRPISSAPILPLDHQTMREIAREVWYEINRRSLPYKAIKLINKPRSRKVAAAPLTNSSSRQLRKSNAKRIAFFAHFDRDGIIDDYVIYYLNNLRQVAEKILFVSDCDLREGEALKLQNVADLVFASRHGAYDFGSWKICFDAVGYEFSGWDELIIANDSCYAPLFPLESAFDLIDDCDFWGASKEPYSRVSGDIAAKRGEWARTSKSATVQTVPELEDFDFVNSYFMVFKKNILGDERFLDFWRNVSAQEEKERVIELYEMGLTKMLNSLGYRNSSFAVRAGEVIYKKYAISVPVDFQFPWLRVLICKVNDELVKELDKELDKIQYPRFFIDQHIRRMIGTSHPPHYYLPEGHSFFGMIKSKLTQAK